MSDLVKAPIDVNVDTLNRANSLALCQQRPEVAADLICALLAQNTDVLPDTSFVRRDDNVFLKKQKITVKLTESDGTLNPLGRKKVGNDWVPVWDVSLNGYRRLNQLPALQVIKPEYVMVDGQKQMNPFIQVDPKTKMPEVVYSRCTAVGYSPTGTLVATDIMIRLDINIYLLENIQAKMHRVEGDKLRNEIGQYGADDDPPKDEDGNKIPGYRFFPIHSVGGIGLWVNLRSRAIQDILKDHTTRLKFIERLAQSFAERNALKSHPAMPSAVKTDNGVAMVRMTGWTSDFDRDDIRRLQELVEQDRLDEFQDGAGRTLSVASREVITDIDDGDRAAMEEEASREQAQERQEKEKAGIEEEDQETKEHEAAVDQLDKASQAYSRLLDLKGKAGAKAVLKALEIDNLEEASADQLSAFMEKCAEIEAE